MFEKITLSNGVRILFEKVPQVRSVTAGIFVGNGSRYETKAENGASHFIEHMVFKGTENRTASEIAEDMDSIGGQINAYTTKEYTCFYGRVLDQHLDKLLDILADMFFSARFDEKDVISERGVIYEEIDMYEDTPEDLVVERLQTAVHKGSPLAMPILGTKKSLAPMTGDFLRRYMRSHYSPQSTVIALSGNFSDRNIAYLQSRFSEMPVGQKQIHKKAVYHPAILAKRKNIEQNHLCLAFPSISAVSEDRYTMQLLLNILGGGMSSRLFQAVREKYGLCYSVYSFLSNYDDTGLLGIYTALGKETERKALSVIRDELSRFLNEPVSVKEMDRAREQVKADVLMGLESTVNRMTRLAKNELYFEDVPSIDQSIARYEAVTAEDILALARQTFHYDVMSFSAVGKTASSEEYAAILSAE